MESNPTHSRSSQELLLDIAVCGCYHYSTELQLTFIDGTDQGVLFIFKLAELPYGWEKISDPVYGFYYIE